MSTPSSQGAGSCQGKIWLFPEQIVQCFSQTIDFLSKTYKTALRENIEI